MPWPPDIAGDLPAPRDDEPSSLRQDIADELADHLASAFTRELHFTSEETAAKQTVLNRFGDPRRVARQLWFDALKEKIMSQRVNLILSALMTVACLSALGLMIVMLRDSREVNAAILEKLAAIAAQQPGGQFVAEESPRSMEWNPVKVRLVKDVPGGAPSEGFNVRLEGHILDTGDFMTVTRTTGADGVADFGLVRPGQHSIEVEAPWSDWYRENQVLVLPGKGLDMDLVCPPAPRSEAPVSFSVNWPEEYQKEKLCLVCEATLARRQIGGATWNDSTVTGRRYFIITGANEVIGLSDEHAHEAFRVLSGTSTDKPDPFFDVSFPQQRRGPGFVQSWPGMGGSPLSSPARPRDSADQDAEPARAPFRPVHLVLATAVPVPELSWPAGAYTIENIVACEQPHGRTSDDLRTMDVIGGVVTATYPRRGEFPAYNAFLDWVELDSTNRETSAMAQVSKQRGELQPTFDVQAGRSNPVTVTVPRRLREAIERFSKECEFAGRQLDEMRRQQEHQTGKSTN